jgi:hypothetical protein
MLNNMFYDLYIYYNLHILLYLIIIHLDKSYIYFHYHNFIKIYFNYDYFLYTYISINILMQMDFIKKLLNKLQEFIIIHILIINHLI